MFSIIRVPALGSSPWDRVRSIDDQKRIIVPDWMDCTEVPETQHEPNGIKLA